MKSKNYENITDNKFVKVKKSKPEGACALTVLMSNSSIRQRRTCVKHKNAHKYIIGFDLAS